MGLEMEPEKLALPRPELWCWDMMDWLARKGFKAITFELGAPLEQDSVLGLTGELGKLYKTSSWGLS